MSFKYLFFVNRRHQDDKLLLRDDDMLILEVNQRIQQPSLKEHVMKEHQITMEIRTGKREDFDEFQINIT